MDFEVLDSWLTNSMYGYYLTPISCFIGEALNSICAVSKETQIITKTKDDSVAKLYDLDATGSIKRYTLLPWKTVHAMKPHT